MNDFVPVKTLTYLPDVGHSLDTEQPKVVYKNWSQYGLGLGDIYVTSDIWQKRNVFIFK